MPALTIDAPPSLPSGTASQMSAGGGNPFSGMGDLISGKPDTDKAAPSGGGSSGALKAQVDAMKKVLESVIQSSNAGKTFFSRASQLLDQGLAAEAKAGPGTPPTSEPAGSGSTESATMSRPPAASFAG